MSIDRNQESAAGVGLPQVGEDCHAWARDLFPINRSLMGPGVRETLAYLKGLLPDLSIVSAPTGTEAFDWTVPKEWRVRGARLTGPHGETIVDFADHNLHVAGYSVPVDEMLDLEALQSHLHSLPDQPNAIPYVTSYYHETWGFCLPHAMRAALNPGRYHAHIDSELVDGELNYAELILPGERAQEILLATYVCHPSMANNELSGPAVSTALARWLASAPRRYTYRIVFVPETLGAIVYLSRNADVMKERTVAGYMVTCVGDDRAYSFMPSRLDGTLSDRAARLVLSHHCPGYREYSFLERGSDERQYCSPGIDLPVASIMRSKYGTYPEYHTSLDELSLITPAGLQGGFEAIAKCLQLIEENRCYRTTVPCEPQLGRRGLYATTSKRGSSDPMRDMLNVLAYADGTRDLIDLASTIRVPPETAITLTQRLVEKGLLEIVE